MFATSGGSGFGKTVQNLQDSVSDAAVIKEGRMLNGVMRAEEPNAWTEEI